MLRALVAHSSRLRPSRNVLVEMQRTMPLRAQSGRMRYELKSARLLSLRYIVIFGSFRLIHVQVLCNRYLCESIGELDLTHL